MPKKGGLEQFADLRGRGLGKKEGRGGDFFGGRVDMLSAIPKYAHHVFIFGKKKRKTS